LFMIMDILNTCMEKECRVWTIKEGYRLGDDIQSKVLAFAFGLSAEIERKLICQRTREALDLRRAQGIRLGRPVGAQNRSYKLDARKRQICRLLSQSVPHREIARRCHVSPQTLSRWIRRNL
ncbi:MAG: helix-turn-helix domain-containing protein, partial [Bacteroidales bacterium]|nr:helix-turn-helix domain-containing protein [Bacteroidales bacterium]